MASGTPACNVYRAARETGERAGPVRGPARPSWGIPEKSFSDCWCRFLRALAVRIGISGKLTGFDETEKRE